MESSQFDEANIIVKDNTAEEILDITNEIHLFANGQNYYSEKDLDLQKKFKSIFPKEARWHHGKMHGDLKANYSIDFLRKIWIGLIRTTFKKYKHQIKNMKTILIIQCRYNSSRLPGKILLKFKGHSLLSIMLKRFKK